jgi:hypothetical protein
MTEYYFKPLQNIFTGFGLHQQQRVTGTQNYGYYSTGGIIINLIDQKILIHTTTRRPNSLFQNLRFVYN